MFTLACFDLDNTLFDHDTSETAAYTAVANYIQTHLHIHCTIEDLLASKREVKRIGATYERALYFKAFLKKYKLANWLHHVQTCHTIYWDTFYEHMKLFPGVQETISLFHTRRIITNFTLVHQLEKLSKLGIIDMFDDIISSEECFSSKPSPIIYTQATKGHKMEKCCMIGDREIEDIEGAMCIGMVAICIQPKQHTPLLLQKGQIRVQDFVTLYEFLRSVKTHLIDFIWLCHRVGERSDLTQHTGGNVSIKWTHEMYKLILIKASGCHLAEVNDTCGWSLLYYDVTNKKYEVLFGERPSIETCMHTAMNKPIVIHCHPPSILSCSTLTPFIPYVPPGEELASILLPFHNSPVIYLGNHGIVVSDEEMSDALVNLDRYCHATPEQQFCNRISEKRKGGITLLSKNHLSNVSNQFFTPDTAVFLCEIFTCLDEARNERFVLVHEGHTYCHAPTLQSAKAMLELLDVHIQLSQSGILPLPREEINRLQNRPDEKFRLAK